MSKANLQIGSFLFLLNILLCMLLSSYSPFHAAYTGTIIAITVGLISLLHRIQIPVAFNISLSYSFITLGFIEFVISLFSSETIQDNWIVVLSLVLLVAKLALITLIYNINKITK